MRLGVLWALFVASGKMFIRNRAAVFFSLFLPLIIMLIFGVLNFEGATEIQLGVADEADNEASAALVASLGEYEYLVITEGEREAEMAELAEGDRDFVLVIPAGWTVPPPGVETGLVAYAGNADPAQAQVAQGLFQQAVAQALYAPADGGGAPTGVRSAASSSSRSSRATSATSTSSSRGSWA